MNLIKKFADLKNHFLMEIKKLLVWCNDGTLNKPVSYEINSLNKKFNKKCFMMQ